MAALQLLRDGVAIAAEFAALLFLAPLPAAAAESAGPSAAEVAPARTGRMTALHVTDAAFEVRLLGALADLRVVQAVRNDGPVRVDLGSHLPAVAQNVDQLAITRNGRMLDLLGGSACDGVDDSDSGDDPDEGHAQTDDDEARADLLQLPPGQSAYVAVSVTEPLQPWGDAWRLQLPATVAAPGAQARVVRHSGGLALLVIPPADATGLGTLTLRPEAAAARAIRLGQIVPGFVHVIPVDTLARESATLELEIVSATRVQWMTLAPPAAPVTLAHGTH